MNNRQVAHVWANQSRPSANGHNPSFSGSAISSYAMQIGNIVERKGERAALLTTDGYSVTTAKHKSYASGACSHLKRFHVPSLVPDHKKNLKHYRQTIFADARAVCRARSSAEFKRDALQRLIDEANAYAEFFGLATRFAVPNQADLDAVEKMQREAAAKHRRQQEKTRAAAEVIRREAAAKWQAGEKDICPSLDSVLLRIKGDEVETSRGASVPLRHALRLLKLVRSGVPYQHNGHTEHVGDFRVDSIDAGGNVVAGCHTIKREEFERLAATIGK